MRLRDSRQAWQLMLYQQQTALRENSRNCLLTLARPQTQVGLRLASAKYKPGNVTGEQAQCRCSATAYADWLGLEQPLLPAHMAQA